MKTRVDLEDLLFAVGLAGLIVGAMVIGGWAAAVAAAGAVALTLSIVISSRRES